MNSRVYKYTWVTTLVMLLLFVSGCATTGKDWKEARTTNTVDAYEMFLKKHPDSEFAIKSRKYIEELKWVHVKEINTLDAYKEYISVYPHTTHMGEALREMEAIKYQEAITINKIPALKYFLERYPDGVYKSSAESALATLQEELQKELNGSLVSAINEGNVDEVNRWIKKGADVSHHTENKETPLLVAINKKSPEIVRMLLEEKADAEVTGHKGETPLISAVDNELNSIVDILIRYKANVNGKRNGKDTRNETPLHIAAQKGLTEISNVLIQNGAEIDAVDRIGETPLFWSTVGKRTVMFKWLVGKGADIGAKNKHGQSLLMKSIRSGSTDIAKYLIGTGAPLTENDDSGNSVIMYAAAHGNLDIVKLLISRGVGVDGKNNKGGTVFSYGKKSKNKQLISFLYDINYNKWKSKIEQTNTSFNLKLVDLVTINSENVTSSAFAAVVDITGNNANAPIYVNPISTSLKSKSDSLELVGIIVMSIDEKACANFVGRLSSGKYKLGSNTYSTSPSGPYYDGKVVINSVSGGINIVGGNTSVTPGSIIETIFNRQGAGECPFSDEFLTLVTYIQPLDDNKKKELKKNKANDVFVLSMCGRKSMTCGAELYLPKNTSVRLGLIFQGNINNASLLKMMKKKIRL